MKRVFEYWQKVYKPGYEIVGASSDVFRAIPNSAGVMEPLNPIEPMLTLREGFNVSLRYEFKLLAINDYPALFLHFAQLEKTPEAVERFANTFGFLLHGITHTIALPSFQKEYVIEKVQSAMEPHRRFEGLKGLHICYAEPVQAWYAFIDEMRDAIHLWETARAGSEDVTVKLQESINARIEGATAAVHMASSGSSLELVVSPTYLISALWLQFALAVDGRKAYKQCPTCQNWFEIGKWGSRGDKKFCSNKCRQAAYDARQRKQKK